MLHTVRCMPHTSHCKLYSVHWSLHTTLHLSHYHYTANSTLRTVHCNCKLQTANWVRQMYNTEHCLLHTVDSKVSAYWPLHTANCKLPTAHYTFHTVHTAKCALYTVQCTLQTSNCTLQNADCTLNTAICSLNTAICILHTSLAAHCINNLEICKFFIIHITIQGNYLLYTSLYSVITYYTHHYTG